MGTIIKEVHKYAWHLRILHRLDHKEHDFHEEKGLWLDLLGEVWWKFQTGLPSCYSRASWVLAQLACVISMWWHAQVWLQVVDSGLCSAGSDLQQGNKHFLELLERLKTHKNSESVHHISLAGEDLVGFDDQYHPARTHEWQLPIQFFWWQWSLL